MISLQISRMARTWHANWIDYAPSGGMPKGDSMDSFNDEQYESSNSRFLTGMLWGMAIGAAAALLLAPRRGAELRGQMADSMNRAGRRAKDTYDRASETVNDLASRATNIAENLSDRAANLTAKLNKNMSEKTSSMVS
jgi:gas vesicle protein